LGTERSEVSKGAIYIELRFNVAIAPQ